MGLINRRRMLQGLAGMTAAAAGLGAYAFGIEPLYRLAVRNYRVAPQGWPAGLDLRLVVIADVHAGEPSMPAARIEEIVAKANSLSPDAILLLGDFAAGHRFITRWIPASEWAPLLAQCRAPLGVHAVLGNHDWWDDRTAQRSRSGPVVGRRALEKAGVPVYENDAVRLAKDGRPFWLAGLGDQIAFILGIENGRRRFRGIDDLAGTLSRITDDAPVVMMAHEPDVFARMPKRVSLTISGHTHGGQVRLFGYSPMVPSQFGNRYAYGHVVENDRHLVVSGGLGCSILPVRFGVPPEIVVVDVHAPADSSRKTV